MLRPVANSRRAFAAQASKLSCTGPRDDEIGLLRRAALEYSSALEHKAARFPCNLPDDALWQRSSSTFLRRTVAAILVEDEGRYRSTRIANKGDLCGHALGEEVVVALGPKLRRGAAYARPDMERPVLQRDVELQA